MIILLPQASLTASNLLLTPHRSLSKKDAVLSLLLSHSPNRHTKFARQVSLNSKQTTSSTESEILIRSASFVAVAETEMLKSSDGNKNDRRYFRDLVDWVDFYGGYVHPNLELGYSRATGTRGLIAKKGISKEEMTEGPLIAVPDSLSLNLEVAERNLGPIFKHHKSLSLSLFSAEFQVALLLAHEKNKGHRSFYYPYIQTLPEMPGCGWAMDISDLRLGLALLPINTIRAADLAVDFKNKLEENIRGTLSKFVNVLDIKLEDLMWALGQVHSRATGKNTTLMPVIDLINHDSNALPILDMMDEDDGDDIPVTYVGSFYKGHPRVLYAGDELFVKYRFPETIEMFSIFMHFGFLPIELHVSQI